MNNSPDFTDQLELYAAKMRQEHGVIEGDEALVRMIRYRAKLRALHEEACETESMRRTVSMALAPFAPERPPVALQSAPAQPARFGFDSEAEFFGDDLYDDVPKVVRGMRA